MNSIDFEQGLIKCQNARATLLYLINARENERGIDELVRALEGTYDNLDMGLTIIEGIFSTSRESNKSHECESVKSNEVSNDDTKLKEVLEILEKHYHDEMLVSDCKNCSKDESHSIKIKLHDYEDILFELSDISDAIDILGDNLLPVKNTGSNELAPLVRIISHALRISYNQFASVGDILYNDCFDKKHCDMMRLNALLDKYKAE